MRLVGLFVIFVLAASVPAFAQTYDLLLNSPCQKSRGRRGGLLWSLGAK